MKTKHLKLTYFTDLGHGWLQVPTKILNELNLINAITPYSYINGSNAYLEEDCDLSTFIRKLESIHWTYEFTYKNSSNSKIRSFDSFTPEAVINHSKIPTIGMIVKYNNQEYILLCKLNHGSWMVAQDTNQLGNSFKMTSNQIKSSTVVS